MTFAQDYNGQLISISKRVMIANETLIYVKCKRKNSSIKLSIKTEKDKLELINKLLWWSENNKKEQRLISTSNIIKIL